MRLYVSISIKLPLLTDVIMNFTAETQICYLFSSRTVLFFGCLMAGAAL